MKTNYLYLFSRVPTRFPGKVLKDIGNLPSIVYQYNRVVKSKLADHIAILIPDDKENDILEDTLIKYDIPYFRGEASNVLQRFIDAASYYETSTIIRINGDCPLISPSTIDHTIKIFQKEANLDYASTILDSSYPLGEHCECFSLNSLLKGHEMCEISSEYAEHVTPLKPKKF